jgi:hypothetical protein
MYMHAAAFLLQDQPSQAQIMQMASAFIGIFAVMMMVGIAIIVIPFWFICKKAGFSPWLTLINIVPMGNLVLLYVLAFAEWKVVPAPAPGWTPQPPYPPQPPLPPQV